MMLSAAVSDLLRVDAVEVAVMRDSRLELPDLPIEVHWVETNWYATWRDCLAQADAVLPIAPETGGILEGLCREAEAVGCLLLNSNAEAVALTASKQRTLERLAQAQVPVADSYRADSVPHLPTGALVIKPDRGVGCQDIHLLLGESALDDFLEAFGDREDWVVQPYVEGTAASLSLLVGRECVCLLGANLQRVVQVDDGFLLLGCVVNGLRTEREPLHQLARQICKAIPGLFGYVGVDLVMTEQGPVVLEINPRLTTSYVGLSQSTGENVAERILRLALDPYDLPAQPMFDKSVHIDLELGRVA